MMLPWASLRRAAHGMAAPMAATRWYTRRLLIVGLFVSLSLFLVHAASSRATLRERFIWISYAVAFLIIGNVYYSTFNGYRQLGSINRNDFKPTFGTLVGKYGLHCCRQFWSALLPANVQRPANVERPATVKANG